ncbi:glycosyltransferase family 4 protein [Salipaludibacillus sp. LMS25]|jgi:glycosyltransferase involved in cell wall biosynthesis|uniref:glycosyltransferase family 4 protein n=1 Tax=Salipaludibacillus sp. LMS25 TaxID=2924031 RepID=UPI0020D0903E|nr:glycosyltransferase family 4 protein [Salipaludibacillus sp. LMS25]
MNLTKVLYISSSFKRGGPTNQLFYIVNNLDRTRFTPEIITLSPEPKESDIEKFKNSGVKLHTLNLPKLFGIMNGSKKIIKTIEKIKPDLIHTQGIRADRFSAKNLAKYRRVSTMRNYAFEDYLSTYGKILGYIMASLHLRYLKMIDMPVACSYSVQEKFKKHKLDMNVVQNGVDTKIYKPVVKEQMNYLREKLNLPLTKSIFIATGHITERKDPLTIIDAFLKSNMSESGFLLMLGDGDLRKKCEDKTTGKDNIRFIGRVSNVAEFIQASDFFISASKAEGLPNALLEAMACGLPACLSDIEPHIEILKTNMSAGKLAKVENSESFKSAINQLTSSEYDKCSDAALGIILGNFDSLKMSYSYQKIYKNILK